MNGDGKVNDRFVVEPQEINIDNIMTQGYMHNQFITSSINQDKRLISNQNWHQRDTQVIRYARRCTRHG